MIGFLFTSADGEKTHVVFLRVVSPPWKLQGQSEEGERGKRRGFPSLNIHQIYPVIALQGAACVEHYEHGSMQMTQA